MPPNLYMKETDFCQPLQRFEWATWKEMQVFISGDEMISLKEYVIDPNCMMALKAPLRLYVQILSGTLTKA